MNHHLIVWGVGLVLLASPIASAETKDEDRREVGRFQLVVGGDATLYVLDTATGRVSSKAPNRPWTDLGALGLREESRPLSLRLGHDVVEMTIKERHSKAIPGSNGEILIYLDNVTDHQVLLSVRSDQGKMLQDDVSVRQGDIVSFPIGMERFYIRIKELKDFTIAEDFVILEVAADREALSGQAVERRADQPEKPRKP